MKYLYHYTTLENLALILDSKTIRFKPLDTMDDLQESMSKGIANAGQFIFVSSWTDVEVETIPMWNMYADLKSGVRIALPMNPFEEYEITVGHVCEVKGNCMPDYLSRDTVFRKSLYPISDIFDGKFFSPDMLMELEDNDDPVQVEYTNEKEKLYPNVLIDDEDELGFDIGCLGVYKNKAWEFQSEWRYKLTILPGSAKEYVNKSASKIFKDMVEGKKSRPCGFYDRKIDSEALRKMRITKSPCFSESSEILLNSLVSKFAPEITIKESRLKDMIR